MTLTEAPLLFAPSPQVYFGKSGMADTMFNNYLKPYGGSSAHCEPRRACPALGAR